MFRFESVITYPSLGSVAYRNWQADTHCRLFHGHDLSFTFYFGANQLDKRGWVLDFGSLKPFKAQLEEWFDHTVLIAQDDPEKALLLEMQQRNIAKVVEVAIPSCEGIAFFLYDYLNSGYLQKTLGYTDVWCWRVEVQEGSKGKGIAQGYPAE